MTLYHKSLLNIVCGLLLISSIPAMSQDLKLAGFSYTRFPSTDIVDSRLNQSLQVSEYNFFLNLPKPLKNKKTFLIHGFQYRLVVIDGDNDLRFGLDKQNLNLIGYRLTALHQLKNDWKVMVSLNPTLSSTFNKALERDDFLFNGLFQFIKKKSERLSYGAGVAYISTFGEPAFLPTLQLTYKSKKDKFQILLPHHITYDHHFGRFTAGLQLSASGSRYNVNNSRTHSLNSFELVDQLAYSRVIFGPSLRYRIGKVIQLEASGGFTVGRRAELQGDLYEEVDYDINNGFFLQFGISVLPPKKNN